MKLVLDTNVVVSGIFFGGVPGRVLAAWSVGAVDLVLSPDILEEYRRVGADLAIRHRERSFGNRSSRVGAFAAAGSTAIVIESLCTSMPR